MVDIRLKLCPFCGGQAEMKMLKYGRDMPELCVKCESCGAEMRETSIYDDIKSMESAWNRRVHNDP